MITRQVVDNDIDGREIRETTIVRPAVQTIVPAHPAAVSRISWAALLGGLVTALVLQMLLSTLGIAVGLTAIDATNASADSGNFGIGAGLWWLVSGLVSLFVGGMVAARAAGIPVACDACMHGFIVWALSAVVGVALLGTAVGTVIGGATAILTNEVDMSMDRSNGGAIGAIERGAEELTGRDIDLRSGASREGDADSREGAETDPDRAFDGDGDAISESELRAGADDAADALTPAAWWTFGALLLGVGAASLGGLLGTPKRVTAVPVAH